MATSGKETAAKRVNGPTTKQPATNGVRNGATRNKTERPKLNNAKLLKLAEKLRPPQSWYDEEHSLF
jgi:hypothetical protein